MESNQVSQKEKKQLLQKLMTNLLGKPGRSFHELSNGVKNAIATYKTFSKEWDTLNGADGGQEQGSGINRVLDTVRQKKSDGSGGPGAQGMPQFKQMPQQAQGVPQRPTAPMGGQPPAPQFNQMPQQAQGVPQRPAAPPVRVNGGAPEPLIAGPEQTSSFNRPAPINNLGIHGF
jgi:hypothetical protein